MTSDNFDIRKYNQDYNGGVIVNNGTYNYNSGNITLSNKNFISSKESEYSALITNNENATFNVDSMNIDTNKLLFNNSGTINYNPTKTSSLTFALMAVNNESGVLNITGSNSTFNGNMLIDNMGTATINNLNSSSNSVYVIGRNTGTMTVSNSKFKSLDRSKMESILSTASSGTSTDEKAGYTIASYYIYRGDSSNRLLGYIDNKNVMTIENTE
jgi:hypothetical protein